jgi:hypothetical protein
VHFSFFSKRSFSVAAETGLVPGSVVVFFVRNFTEGEDDAIGKF